MEEEEGAQVPPKTSGCSGCLGPSEQRSGSGRGRAAKPTRPRKVLGPRPLPCSGMCPCWVLGSTPVPAARCCPSCGSQSAPVPLPPGLRCVPVRHSAQTSRAGSGRSPSPVPSANQCDQQPPAGSPARGSAGEDAAVAAAPSRLPVRGSTEGSAPQEGLESRHGSRQERGCCWAVENGVLSTASSEGGLGEPGNATRKCHQEMPPGNATSVPRWSILAAAPGSSSD